MRTRRRSWALLTLVLFGSSLATVAAQRDPVPYDVYSQKVYTTGQGQGDEAWWPDGIALCTADREQWYPKVVNDGTGKAIAAWHDGRGGGTGHYDIYAQKTNEDGDIQWAEDGAVVSNAAGDQTQAVLVADGNGGVILAWWDWRNGPPQIYAQHLNWVGERQWAQDVAICAHQSGVWPPLIVTDDAGGAIIAWLDSRNGGTADDVYAQRVSGGGTVQWLGNGVAVCTAAGNQQELAMVTDGSNGAILAWTDQRNLAQTGYDIYAQRIDGNGAAQWTANGVAVCSANLNQYVPAVETDLAHGAVVVWADRREGINKIYGQRLNSAGAGQWGNQGKRITNAESYLPVLATDLAGGALIAWEDFRNGVDADVYAQRATSAGVLWPNDLLICDQPGGQGPDAAVQDGAGGAIFAWQDARVGDTQDDIYAQRAASDGHAVWHDDGIPVCAAIYEQESPQMAYVGGGAAVVVWMDRRSPPLHVPTDDGSATTSVVRLMPNRPNPFGRETAIRFELTQAGHASVLVLGGDGRVVARLLESELGAGRYTIPWSGRDAAGALLPSGIYPYRVAAGGVTAAGKLVLAR